MAETQEFNLVFIILALIYGVLSCFAIFRLCKLRQFTSEWRHSKFFYVTLILHVVLRTIGFVTVAVAIHSSVSTSGYLLLSIPDSLFIVSFLLIFWQMISVYFYSHIEHSLERSLIAALSRRAHQSKPSQMFVFLLIIWIGTQICLYVALCLGRITQKSITNEVGIMNVILPTVAISTLVYLQRKYSGSPAKSTEWKKRLHKMNVISLLWSCCRYFRGVIEILNVYGGLSMTGDFTDMVATIVLITCLIISEVICLFLVLDYSFIAIFVLSETEKRKSLDSNGSMLSLQPIDESVAEDSALSRRFTILSESPTIDVKEITSLEPVLMQSHNLGHISKGVFRMHKVAYRRIVFPKKSNYIVDEFAIEIESLRLLTVPGLLPLQGANVIPSDDKGNCVFGLIYPWMANGSLFDAIHERKVRMSDSEKRRIAKEVAVCLQGLHAVERVHGHLTSKNVLLDEKSRVFISDLGLQRLKKYAGITLGYTNKSAYSSPQLLTERTPTPLKANATDDVYSYGVVLWELMTEMEPFEGCSLKVIASQVGEMDKRPVVPEGVGKDMSGLIRSCWNSDPAKRPSFSHILEFVFESGVHTIN